MRRARHRLSRAVRRGITTPTTRERERDATREEGERVETRFATILSDEDADGARGRVRRRDDARGRDAGSVELGEQVYVAVHDVLVADIRDRRR